MASPSPAALERGLDRASALLSQLGVEVSPHALSERLGLTPSQESWAEAVRAHGRPARVVRVDAQKLAKLPMPTLLFREGTPFCLVREVRGSRALTEAEHGQQATIKLTSLVAGDTCALELHGSVSGLSSLRTRLVHLLSGERTTLLQLAAVSALAAGLGLVAPILTGVVMDRALPDRAPQLLLALSLAVALVGLQRALLSFLRERLVIGLNARNAHTLARDGLAHVLGMSFAAHGRFGLGGLLQFVTSTESMGRLITNIGMRPLLDGLLGLFTLAMIGRAAPLLAGALPASALIVVGAGCLIARAHAGYRREQLGATIRERARLHELVSGIATIKAAGAERHCMARWLVPMLDQSVAQLHGDLTASWYGLLFAWFGYAARVAVFLWGAGACLAGDLSVGMFVSLAMQCDIFVSSVASMGEAVLVFWGSRVEVDKIDAILAEPSEPLLSRHGSERAAATGDVVVLNDVWFRYGPDQPWVLKGYNLRVRAGEQLTLRSASGSGKTTILRLIAGLYRPERGTVSVFGRDPAQVRGHVAYLPQHAHMFAGSLLHNLRLLSGASLERILEACQVTGLGAFVSTLPMNLETVVPAGGSNLSGGQRQWILLTAAVASERRLLLMDESLSSLDTLTRARLRQGASFQGKTVVWVSHED